MRVAKPAKPAWGALALAVAALAGAGTIIVILGRNRSSVDPARLWQDAEAEVEARHWERASAALDRLDRVRPPEARRWLLRARIAQGRGRDPEALAALDRVADRDPNGAEARLLAGRIELRRHRARFAEDQMRRAATLDPSLVQAHRELIYLYGMQQRRDDLAAEFRALSRLQPLRFADVFLWSMSQGAAWEPIDAAATLARFVAADPADRRSRLALADLQRKLGRFDESARVLGPLPATDPDARVIRVELRLAHGDEAGARAQLGDGPDDHAGLARLRGRLALARRDGQEAARHFRAAERLQPDYRESLFGLGNALQLLGEGRESKRYLDRARRLEVLASLLQRAATAAGRSDRMLPHELGDACATLGRRDEARAWYKLAIARDPLDARAQRALFRLDDRPGRAPGAFPKEAGSAVEGPRAAQ